MPDQFADRIVGNLHLQSQGCGITRMMGSCSLCNRGFAGIKLCTCLQESAASYSLQSAAFCFLQSAASYRV
jgi:hypothetical protein